MAETEESPIPLQAVVCVICDALADLQHGDQMRALAAVRITLGGTLGGFATTAPSDPASASLPIELVAELSQSLRPEQLEVLMQTLDMTQKIILMEILNSVRPREQ